jgi:chromosomal replication initiation ATPase DnaA
LPAPMKLRKSICKPAVLKIQALPWRAPVPTYLWGSAGCGKTHLLKAVREALRERGASVGWLDATVLDTPAVQ